MKTRHLLMGVCLLITAGLALFGDKRPADVVKVVTPEPRPRAEQRPTDTSSDKAFRVLPLIPRRHIATSTPVETLNDAMFQPRSWTPPHQSIMTASPAEQAPPLTLTYLGILENSKAQIDKVLLADGDTTLVVGIDDQIGDRYKVRSISRQAIVLEYLPLRQQQTLSIQ